MTSPSARKIKPLYVVYVCRKIVSVQYGYARVSIDDQRPVFQLAALQKAGCTTVFKDDGTAGAMIHGPALARWLKALRLGATLIVWKLDRLGYSLRDLISMLDAL